MFRFEAVPYQHYNGRADNITDCVRPKYLSIIRHLAVKPSLPNVTIRTNFGHYQMVVERNGLVTVMQCVSNHTTVLSMIQFIIFCHFEIYK